MSGAIAAGSFKSTAQSKAAANPAAKRGAAPAGGTGEKREKRAITGLRESKKAGEKMVYMSVPDYTSAQWAEMAGVDVAVLGDSLALITPGPRSTLPATK